MLMNPELLVNTDWLEQHLDDSMIRIVDARAQTRYFFGHIKNAVNVSYPSVTALRDDGVRVVAPKAVIEKLLSQAGVDEQIKVVIYGEQGGLDAAYVFWVLEYYGHPNVALLDGGIEAWVRANKTLTHETPVFPPRAFKAEEINTKRAKGEWLLHHLDDPKVQILDNRSAEEYTGKDVLARRGGHVPGAIWVEWVHALNPDATFKSQKELEQIFSQLGVRRDKISINYCQTGVRSAHVYFTLRLLGYPDVRVYDASWSEWGNDERFPVETTVMTKSYQTQNQEGIVTHRLDIRGEMCPYTLINTKQKMAQLAPGERLEILIDNFDATETIPTWAKNAGHRVLDLKQIEGGWKILLEKS